MNRRIGPIGLAPGILPRHVGAYLIGAFFSIALFSYLTSLTPYVLKVNLGLPEDQHGRLSGNLQFIQEIAILLAVGWWGALSDRLGRRFVLMAGFLITALAYVLYPLATSVPELLAYRLLFGLGVAAGGAMLTAVVAGDFPDERSRGSLTGLTYFVQGLGATVSFFLLTKLPETFVARGVDELWAGRYAYFVLAALGVVAALAFRGMPAGRPAGVTGRRPVRVLLTEGLAAGRNPRIALSYASSFAARADMVMVTLFLTLWIVQLRSRAGASPAEAASQAGLAIGITQAAALLWSPLFGMLGDRLHKVTVMALAFALAVLGYGALALTPDPSAADARWVLVLLGVGQASAILAPALLLGQEATSALRGSTFGLQAMFGGLGILAMSLAGGRLFDGVGPSAPFALMAIANGLVLVGALAVRRVGLR
ncbi:MAG: MFS transporter [Gammaproteobacteria bacterium]